MDIVINPELLGGGDWNTPRALPGGMFRSANHLHVVWRVQQLLPQPGGPPYYDNSRVFLVSSVFEPTTGQSVDTIALDIFPNEITTSASGLYSVAGRADGSFVVGFDYPVGATRPQRALFASSTETSPSKIVVLPVDGDPEQIGLQTAAAWDGEAFAMHAYGAPPQFTLHVARVSESGAVLLPFTQYGQTMNVNYILDGHVTSTDPESGRTYVFDSFSDNVLNGHLRTGESFTGGAKKIQAVGLSPTTTANKAVVSADAAGAWVGWTQISETNSMSFDGVVQRITSDGTPTGDASVFPATLGAPLGDLGGIGEWVLFSGGTDGVLAFAATGSSIYSMAILGGVAQQSVVLMDGASAPQLDARDLEVIETEGERWVFFSEKHQGHVAILRAVKAAEGCIYPAALGKPE